MPRILPIGDPGRGYLDAVEYATAKEKVRALHAVGQRIDNRTMRKAASLTYDQTIRFFRVALAEGFLERRGKSAGTFYMPGSAWDKT